MTHTAVVDMNVAAVAMAEGSNVKVCWWGIVHEWRVGIN